MAGLEACLGLVVSSRRTFAVPTEPDITTAVVPNDAKPDAFPVTTDLAAEAVALSVSLTLTAGLLAAIVAQPAAGVAFARSWRMPMRKFAANALVPQIFSTCFSLTGMYGTSR